MILLHMTISGFLSYQEKVEVDFSEFDLACISGANGAGKSSLLEAITWVLFGEARRRDDTVINHQSDTAEVILEFLYENETYQVQRAKKRDKSTVLEFRIRTAEGTWKALTEASMRGTEQLISATLHLDYDTFINSAFFLQGKADQFAQQNPGSRKKILSSILGLDVWELYKEEAARRRRLLENKVNAIDEQLTIIEEELKLESERKIRLAALEKELVEKNALYSARKSLLDQQRVINEQVKHETAQLQKQAADVEHLRQELEQNTETLSLRKQEKENHQEIVRSEKTILEELAAWEAVRSELEKLDGIAAHFNQFKDRRQAPLLIIERESTRLKAEHDTLLTQQSGMLTIESELPILKKQIQGAAEEIERLTQKLAEKPALETQIMEIREEKARAIAENSHLKAQAEELKEQIVRVKEVTGAACPTCEKPLSPSEREKLLLDLEDRLQKMRSKYAENTSKIEASENLVKEKETAIAELARVQATLTLQQKMFDNHSGDLERKEKELATWNSQGAVRLRELDLILEKEDFAQDARAELAVIDNEMKDLGYDPVEHEKIRHSELAGRSSQEKQRQLETSKEAITLLEREIISLETRIGKDEKRLAQMNEDYRKAEEVLRAKSVNLLDINLLETEYYDANEAVKRTNLDVGFVHAQIENLSHQREQKALKIREKEETTLKIANLKSLEAAFGKDGIPALLIEQALPEIQMHANDILDRLSNGSMALSFETQMDYKDKKRTGRRETLDILVRDAAGERAYELFSGGEAFRINFAIRMALSQMLTKRAGARLQTLVIDEGFGSQDAEGLQRLIEAINLSRSDFAKILVISHLDEMKDAFSARIEVTKTPAGSRVQVVAG